MTEKVFFDTDCISSFLWVGEKNVLEELFDARIVIPEEVYEELSDPRVPHLKRQVDELLHSGKASIRAIEVGTGEYYIFRELTKPPTKPVIGKGEGAAIALARACGGILASNNLRDVSRYVKKYQLEHYTTLEILVLAEEKKLLQEIECESIWREMKSKGIMLPAGSYMENKANET